MDKINWFILETLKTLKNPLRIKNLFNKKQLMSWRWSFRPEEKTILIQEENSEFKKRNYQNYEEYIRHQRSKLDRFMLDWENVWIKDYDVYYRDLLRERITPHISTRGLAVLCLAARLGTEVKAFIDVGCFAIGIDLNPGKENKYVVTGDFHQLQYADESTDIIFTNSFDHVLYPEKILSEMKRILKPKGKIFIEIAQGSNDGSIPGDYESFFWNKIEDIIQLIEAYSFKVIYQETIKKPFDGGQFIIFEKIYS